MLAGGTYSGGRIYHANGLPRGSFMSSSAWTRQKADLVAALIRCRVLAAKIANELRNKRPEYFIDKLSLADIDASLERAADALSTVNGLQPPGRQCHRQVAEMKMLDKTEPPPAPYRARACRRRRVQWRSTTPKCDFTNVEIERTTGYNRARQIDCNLAVLRLMISSNSVASCTGRSPGFIPLRMRST